MNIPHILTEIINKPLMITPDKLSVILGVLNKKSDNIIDVDFSDVVGASKGTPEAAVMRPVNETEQNAIAVISCIGSLVDRNHGYSDSSGFRSYRTLQYEIQKAINDPEIGGIILDIDTYGGMVAGLDRFSQFLVEAKEHKPIYALVDLNCYSAGYYFASACSKVILTDQYTAGVGSIGCILIHAEISKHNEKEGYTYSVFFFGAKKNDYSPLSPLSEDMKKALNEQVEKFGEQFVVRVAEYRNIPFDTVRGTEAGCYVGQAAIDKGLADEIATFDEAVAMMAAEIEQRKTTGVTAMTTKERIAALLEKNTEAKAALAELGFIPREEAASDEKVLEIAAGNERDRIQGILTLGGFDAESAIGKMAFDPSFTKEKAALEMVEKGITIPKSDKQDRKKAAQDLADDAVEIPLVDGTSGAETEVEAQELTQAVGSIVKGANQLVL